jgi:hypothetical protein
MPEAWAIMVVRLTIPVGRSMAVVRMVAIASDHDPAACARCRGCSRRRVAKAALALPGSSASEIVTVNGPVRGRQWVRSANLLLLMENSMAINFSGRQPKSFVVPSSTPRNPRKRAKHSGRALILLSERGSAVRGHRIGSMIYTFELIYYTLCDAPAFAGRL